MFYVLHGGRREGEAACVLRQDLGGCAEGARCHDAAATICILPVTCSSVLNSTSHECYRSSLNLVMCCRLVPETPPPSPCGAESRSLTRVFQAEHAGSWAALDHHLRTGTNYRLITSKCSTSASPSLCHLPTVLRLPRLVQVSCLSWWLSALPAWAALKNRMMLAKAPRCCCCLRRCGFSACAKGLGDFRQTAAPDIWA